MLYGKVLNRRRGERLRVPSYRRSDKTILYMYIFRFQGGFRVFLNYANGVCLRKKSPRTVSSSGTEKIGRIGPISLILCPSVAGHCSTQLAVCASGRASPPCSSEAESTTRHCLQCAGLRSGTGDEELFSCSSVAEHYLALLAVFGRLSSTIFGGALSSLESSA